MPHPKRSYLRNIGIILPPSAANALRNLASPFDNSNQNISHGHGLLYPHSFHNVCTSFLLLLDNTVITLTIVIVPNVLWNRNGTPGPIITFRTMIKSHSSSSAILVYIRCINCSSNDDVVTKGFQVHFPFFLYRQ